MRLILLFLLGWSLFSQTRVHPDQVVLPAFRSPEEAWCPGPILQVQGDRLSVLLGRNWSNASPCYMHFNITPPAAVDPVSVSSQVEPITIAIKTGFTGDDNAYVYALAPTFSPAAQAKIQVAVKSATAVSCAGCQGGVITDTRAVRTFPPNSVPIGFLAIRGGKFLPKADELLSRQQIYLGTGAEMAVRPDQGGYWFEVNPAIAAATQLSLRAAALESTRTATQERLMAALPPADVKLQAMESRLQYLEKEYMALHARVPADPAAVQRGAMQLEEDIHMMRGSLQSSMEAAHEQVREWNMRVMAELDQSMRISPPSDPSEPCTDRRHWAQDEKYLYRCVVDGPTGTNLGPAFFWVRMEYDRKWKPKPKPQPKVNTSVKK